MRRQSCWWSRPWHEEKSGTETQREVEDTAGAWGGKRVTQSSVVPASDTLGIFLIFQPVLQFCEELIPMFPYVLFSFALGNSIRVPLTCNKNFQRKTAVNIEIFISSPISSFSNS